MQKIFGGMLCACLMTWAVPAIAQGNDRLQPDFTFKRVGVPTRSAGNRITVQITPQAPATSSLPQVAVAPAPTAPTLPWFWQAVSPDLDDSGPGRLADALGALRDAPSGQGVAAPRLQLMQDIATRHGTDILVQTVGSRVSPALVLAVIAVESAGKPDAVSHAGAQGLMQLMPATAERFGVTERADPVQNIKAGVAYLDWLMGHFGNDPVLVLAGYNAGEGAVRDNDGVPPYAETRAYVPKVLAAWAVARGLCLTPPELVSDGCVFRTNG